MKYRQISYIKFAGNVFYFMENLNPEQPNIIEFGFQKLEKLDSAGRNVSAELFLECLSNPHQIVRIEAVRRVKDYAREDFIMIFGMALSDKCDFVVEEASQALAKINSDKALEVLSNHFFEGIIERPHHIANAISHFGQRGFDILLEGTKNKSPNIRYYSARNLGSTDFELAKNVLEKIEKEDNAKTSFGGLVSTAARKSLKTYNKIMEEKVKKENF